METFETADADDALLWMAVRWEAPAGGVVMVAACDGRVLAARDVGAGEALRQFEVRGMARVLVQVDILVGTGTGFRQEDTVVLDFDGERLSEVFRHPLRVFSAPSCAARTETQYQITRTHDGRKRVVSGWQRRRVTAPEDTHCRNARDIDERIASVHYAWAGASGALPGSAPGAQRTSRRTRNPMFA